MCAIFTWVCRKMDERKFQMARASLQTVFHRGPDGGGFAWWNDLEREPVLFQEGGDLFRNTAGATGAISGDGVLLGHRRLSIIDLSAAGLQPMQYDARYWIVFNGEIYNHIELRAELEKRGRRFANLSDTEVILAAYAEWGSACLARFNGMFAFLIFDARTGMLFAARDRFGVKPLYYWISPDGDLAFASEIKQFSRLPGWNAKVNGQALYDFVCWGVLDHTDETIFGGVFQAPQGSFIEINTREKIRASSSGRLAFRRWYAPPQAVVSMDFEEACEECLRLLTEAVRLRLRSDVPVGSCLSGGLDSSTIVCIASRILKSQTGHAGQLTFSARSEVARLDEGVYMRGAAQAAEAQSNDITPRAQEVFEMLPGLSFQQDEPFGSASIYAQWLVFEAAARKKVRVMLDGQGADETLAGYASFTSFRLASLLRRGQVFSLTKELAAWSSSSSNGFFGPARLLAHGLTSKGGGSGKERRWAERVLNIEKLGAAPKNPWLWDGRPPKTLREFSLVNLTTHLPMLLHWEDRNSMAHSVEARLPFLDYRLVEFAVNAPDEFKLRHGRTKAMLRKAARDIVPDSILRRRDKIGFATGELEWQRGVLKQRYIERLRAPALAASGFFTAQLDDVCRALEAGSTTMGFLPWRLVSVAQWLDSISNIQ
jgi:asparagine synthase (glutamine-hydrolysing)